MGCLLEIVNTLHNKQLTKAYKFHLYASENMLNYIEKHRNVVHYHCIDALANY